MTDKKDVLGRPIKVGDLVCYINSALSNEFIYCLVINEKCHLFSGKIVRTTFINNNNLYLITNLDDYEQKIYDELIYNYSIILKKNG